MNKTQKLATNNNRDKTSNLATLTSGSGTINGPAGASMTRKPKRNLLVPNSSLIKKPSTHHHTFASTMPRPAILTPYDYYPFGMEMPGRTFTASIGLESKFGFNGQMKTNEIAGMGNHNTALFWEYDTRLGRRWNLDPKPQIRISDYAAFGLNPITK